MIMRALLLAASLLSGAAQAGPLSPASFAQVRRAAAAGEAAAAFDLGRMYRNAIGTERDSVRAFGWIETAARKGSAAAMFTLSNMLMAGEGAPRNEGAARRWLEAAAELDYPEALQQIAQFMQEGAMGFERDEQRAAQLMREVAHAMKHRNPDR